MFSSRSRSLFSLFALFLTACPPAASCPGNTVLSADGRCVAAGDGGVGDGGVGDGSIGHDAYVGAIDAGLGPDGCALHTYYADADGDGHGNAAMTTFACTMPTGYVTTMDDCNDACAACHPGGTEVCTGTLDENCDGQVNENCTCTTGMTRMCGASSTPPCHMGMQTCAAGTWGACTGNVDPMAETCNGIDDDCNGVVDNGVTIPTWHPDADHDGHGASSGATMMACTMPTGYVASSDDCDDTNAARFPGNTEICNAIDDDCSGTADNGFACVSGMPSTCTTSCGSTGTYICSSSCTPTACTAPAEVCNGVDDNCDGVADEGLLTVGNPLVGLAASTPSFAGGRLVSLSTGFAVVGTTTGGVGQFSIRTLDAAGGASSAAAMVPTAIAPGGGISFSAHAAGSNVLLAYYTASTYQLAVVSTAGAVIWGPATLPAQAGFTPYFRIRIADADANHATIYASYRSTATPYTYSIKRFRITDAGSTTAFVTNTIDVAPNLSGALSPWAVTTTSAHDYVVYLDATGVTRLVAAASGDAIAAANPIGVVSTAAAAPSVEVISIAIANPTADISASNPLGVVWQDNAADHFIEVRGLSPLTLGTAIQLVGSTGSAGGFLTPPLDSAQIVAAPNPSTGAHSSHWLIATNDVTTSPGSIDRAWTVVGGTGAPSAHTETVPSTTSATRMDMGMAVNGASARFASLDGSGNIVTRPFGCP